MDQATYNRIQSIAGDCLLLTHQERPELKWLKGKYNNYMERNGFSDKSTADAHLFYAIYGGWPLRQTDLLKVRYWRTGQHLPATHQICSLFGRALGLSDEDQKFLLQGYFDGCDQYFTEKTEDPVYLQRSGIMEALKREYLLRIPSEELARMNIDPDRIEHYQRHLYYITARQYVSLNGPVPDPVSTRHITSITYDSELNRTLRLLGNVPRKTIIRHLFLLNMPDLTLERINRQLEALGYLRLREEHTLKTGEHLDWLLIRLLKLYEEVRQTGSSPQGKPLSHNECCQWMQECCRLLDQIWKEADRPHLRFMYFKALD